MLLRLIDDLFEFGGGVQVQSVNPNFFVIGHNYFPLVTANKMLLDLLILEAAK